MNLANRTLNRRQFLRRTAGTAAGLAGMLQAKTPPVYAAKRVLTMLTWSHFIDASNALLRQMADAFGQANNCDVRIDFIPHHDMYIQVPQEQQARSGHDIVLLHFSMSHLAHEALETLDFMDDLGRRLGGWYDMVYEVGQIHGRWVVLPWCCAAMPMTYREDIFQQHGFPPPVTWEAWKETGRMIREASGQLAGVALGGNDDSNITLYALLWSYGASTVDRDRNVIINSPETRRAMTYMKELYETCMTDDVFAWDASGNNQAFMSGKYAWVHNAVSIYGAAKTKAPEIFKVTNHAPTPVGPGGQHGTAIPTSHGIWKFAKEKELAKAFLQYMMEPERLEDVFHATFTYNSPLFKLGEKFDWDRDPKTAKLKHYLRTAHMIGWPAPLDERAEKARVQWVVPDMFTAYVAGKKTLEEAVSWGEAALNRIYNV